MSSKGDLPPSHTKWDPVKKPVQYPAERKCRTLYFSDYLGGQLLRVERGAYITRALARAVERMARFEVTGAVMAHLVDDVSLEALVVIKMLNGRHLTIDLSETFVRLREMKVQGIIR